MRTRPEETDVANIKDEDIQRLNPKNEKTSDIRQVEYEVRKCPTFWWRIFKMKKEAKSPKAVAHKRKYETEYESSPRVRNTDGSWRESVASAVSQVKVEKT